MQSTKARRRPPAAAEAEIATMPPPAWRRQWSGGALQRLASSGKHTAHIAYLIASCTCPAPARSQGDAPQLGCLPGAFQLHTGSSGYLFTKRQRRSVRVCSAQVQSGGERAAAAAMVVRLRLARFGRKVSTPIGPEEPHAAAAAALSLPPLLPAAPPLVLAMWGLQWSDCVVAECSSSKCAPPPPCPLPSTCPFTASLPPMRAARATAGTWSSWATTTPSLVSFIN